jgi:inner membrane protein
VPSILSHPAVPLGLAAAAGTKTIPPGLAFAACAASILPDADAIGFAMGIPYGSLFGHRGFTHSLFFAALIAAAATAFSSRLGAPPGIVFAVVFVSAASHGFLDAMTTGGMGVAFFSPFSNRRYFLPWQLIRVSPVGIAPFFSRWGLRVLASEVVWVWLPAMAIGVLGFLIRRK